VSLIDRFSPKTLRVGLAPGTLTTIEYRGNAHAIQSAFRQELDDSVGHWQPLLTLLATRLREENDNKAAHDMSVVLSSKWYRTMMVPWSNSLLKKEDARHFLKAQFVALYGDAAQNWAIAVDDAAYGMPRLACAIERELHGAIEQVAADSKRRCISVEPILSAAWRAIHRIAGSEVKVFAVIEDGRMTIASVHQGQITAVQSQPYRHAWADELRHEWQRWTLRLSAITDLHEVAVLNLRSDAAKTDLPQPFKDVSFLSQELAPAYRFVICGGLP
jgi:hypothetical protein